MERLRTGVLVIGSGAAGMAAALAAAEAGAEVTVVEKQRTLGGTSVFPVETFAVESKIQRQHGIPLTADEAFKLFMDSTQWKADARLVRTFLLRTASTLDWLAEMGVPFQLNSHFVYAESRLAGHVVKLPGHFGGMLKLMKTRAEATGVELRTSTPVKRLTKTGDSVSGATVTDQSGNVIEVEAGAVIVAAGGFPNNNEMVGRYGGLQNQRSVPVLSPVELMGEAIQMAWEVGATADGMGIALRYDLPSQAGHAKRWNLSLVAHQPYLWVNEQGRRFFDEGTCMSGAYTANALSRQTNASAYLIFDEATRRHLEQNGWDNPMGFDSGTCDDIVGVLQSYVDKGDENIFLAESIEDLARQTGIEPSALAETLEEYNSACERGYDSLFAKERRFLRPVSSPRFYAFKIGPMAYGTVGGIKINHKAEATDRHNRPIAGLYAAGDCANGALSHNFWLAFTLRGLPTSFALNTGRIAGENAAERAAGYQRSHGRGAR